jgi:hypothetical protein
MQAWTQNVKDAGLWTSASVSFDLGKGIDGSLSPEIRFDENISRVAGFFADAGVKIKLHKALDASLEYRFGGRRNDNIYEQRHRFSTGLSASHEIEKFRFKLTTRYQGAPAVGSGEGDVDLRTTWRNKLAVTYDAPKKFEITTAFEIFTGRWSEGLSDWRWQMNIEKALSKRKSVAVGYLIQKDLGDFDMDYVFLLSYSYTLRKKDKEKEPPILITPSF